MENTKMYMTESASPIAIGNRTGQVLFSSKTAESIRDAVLEALSSGADLRYSDLHGANLSYADFGGADFSGANLSGADLGRADLSNADLRGSNLRYANLRGSNLSGANFVSADIRCADLYDADLSVADLHAIRDDLWAVLSSAPGEVAGLRNAIAEGRIDGTAYSGDCACLVGTIANIRHCFVYDIPGLKPDSERPAEVFFLAIAPGDTPETSQFSALALKWVDEWLNNRRAAFGPSEAIEMTK